MQIAAICSKSVRRSTKDYLIKFSTGSENDLEETRAQRIAASKSMWWGAVSKLPPPPR